MKRRDDDLKPSRSTTARLTPLQSVALCMALLVVGALLGYGLALFGPTVRNNQQFPQLAAVYDVVSSDYYYYPDETAERARINASMDEGAAAGALEALDDPYTRYLGIDESTTAEEDLRGKHGGIGVGLRLEHGQLVIASVIPRGPAYEAGILPGDIIIEVDQQPVSGDDLGELVRLIRGEIGTEINLGIAREGATESLSFTLFRAEIVTPLVTWEFVDGTSYLWIHVTLFGDTTVPDLDVALQAAKEHGVTGIILDLRGNGGGWVGAAQQTLGRFLDPSLGPALYEDTRATGEMTALPILTDPDGEPVTLPLVVLIDEGTASAAEIVAGALKAYGRAVVIGTSSYGKGSVQRIYAFPDGSTIRVTVAEWFSPTKERIQGQGITPDILVEPGITDSSTDSVIDAAVTYLDTMMP